MVSCTPCRLIQTCEVKIATAQGKSIAHAFATGCTAPKVHVPSGLIPDVPVHDAKHLPVSPDADASYWQSARDTTGDVSNFPLAD
jgi:hypothetical protein